MLFLKPSGFDTNQISTLPQKSNIPKIGLLLNIFNWIYLTAIFGIFHDLRALFLP